MMTNQDLMKLFGQNIKQLRRQRGLSQQELANTLDMERSHLVAIEGGKKATSFSTLVKLANIFQCPVANFFSHGDTTTSNPLSNETTTYLQEFAHDYRLMKNAIALIQSRATQSTPAEAGKLAVNKVGFELLALLPLLSENAQILIHKFAEGYLNIAKSEDPLIEQIVQDILAQQSNSNSSYKANSDKEQKITYRQE